MSLSASAQSFEASGEEPGLNRHQERNRALSCRDQATFVLAWFRDSPDNPRLGQDFGISQATSYR
jgi:hypothetical protein